MRQGGGGIRTEEEVGMIAWSEVRLSSPSPLPSPPLRRIIIIIVIIIIVIIII